MIHLEKLINEVTSEAMANRDPRGAPTMGT